MIELQTGKIIEWDSRRGLGYLDNDGQKLFLHIREYAERHHLPHRGDTVSFIVGEDFKGRPCAKLARTVSSRSRLKPGHVVTLAALLIIPIYAAAQMPFDLRIIPALVLVLSILTWKAYVIDKSRAQAGRWRIKESRLQFLSLLGGWPGAFLAQKHLRHKTSKGSFLVVFRLIIILHQIVAFDYLADWRFTQAFWVAVKPLFS